MWKCSANIANHQAELIIEEKFTDQKPLSITSIHTNYINLDTSSGSGINNGKANHVFGKMELLLRY